MQEVQFSADGERVATTSAGGNHCVWEVESCKMLASLGNVEQRDITLCFLRDGKQIATAKVGFALL
jgi:hypothetical protein